MDYKAKIKNIDDLGADLLSLRAKGQKIVHCHGVFDLLHVGHIKHLSAARKYGDALVVTITPDRYVNKGPHRPAFTEHLRAEALAALECVDFVAVNEWPSAVETIGILKPDYFVKGIVRGEGKRDHSDAISHESEAVEAAGGAMVFTEEDTYSATTLINRFMDIFSSEARKFLEEFREKYTPEQVYGYINAIEPLRVLTVGDTIIDKYHFCNTLGKGSKEPVLVMQHQYSEVYAGGILAIANHVSNFCNSVGLLSFLGSRNSLEDSIRESLQQNVRATLEMTEGAPTVVKERFLEEYSSTKLLEVHSVNMLKPDKKERRRFLDSFEALLPGYDAVIVADYGQGCLSPEAIELACSKARFLAVNTQANAGNFGFNSISKYPRADYICLTEPELRLDFRDTTSKIKDLVRKLSDQLSCAKITITSGKYGSTCFDRAQGFVDAPVFSVKMVDRIGAGDALLSLTAPLVAMDTPIDIVAFLGNVAGAEACAIMGNKKSIEKPGLFRHIDSLLK
jgi:rfaE bifunctional protein nucleotidyltransferase chain/domain